MKIKLSYITEENLKDLPEWASFPYSCKYCSYWESPQEFNVKTKDKITELTVKKLQWLRNVHNEFGECGIIIYVDGKPAGYAQYAPPKFFPNLSNYPVLPNPDAVFISCLFIFNEQLRRQGFGTVLLNAVIEDLEKRGVNSIETIARKKNPENPAGPVEFYLKNEFIIYKDDKEFPLMKFDL